MKLTATQLRNIICEEVKNTKLHESKNYSRFYSTLMDDINDEWRVLPHDKTIDKLEWNRQCERASEDLQVQFEKLLNNIKSGLLDGAYELSGDFAQGRPPKKYLKI